MARKVFLLAVGLLMLLGLAMADFQGSKTERRDLFLDMSQKALSDRTPSGSNLDARTSLPEYSSSVSVKVDAGRMLAGKPTPSGRWPPPLTPRRELPPSPPA